MENYEEEPFSRIFGTEREDVLLIDPEFSELSIVQIESANKKREQIKKIGFDWMHNNYIPLRNFETKYLHINRRFERSPGDLWKIPLAYGNQHIPPIVKIECPIVTPFIVKSKINTISIKEKNLPNEFKRIVEEVNNMEFIDRVLNNEPFYEATKYKISNLTKKTNGDLCRIMPKIEESVYDTITPFVKLQDFERIDAPVIHNNPRSRQDLGVSFCKAKLFLQFSHIEATNSQYILTMYVKKFGFE